MKKVIIIFVCIIVALIAGIGSMFVFQLCPPQGPWPTPPWCVYYQKVEPYQYQELDYITEKFEKTNKELVFGVGTMDIWGNPHLWIDLGEDATKSVKPTLKRIADIGGELFYITDFVILQNNGNILIPTKKQAPFHYNIKQKELSNIVKEARKNNLKVMMIINLADTEDEVMGYLESAEKAGNEREASIARKYAEFIEKNIGLSTKNIFKNFTKADWDRIFDRWKEIMIYEAKKAENAGVDYLIISPEDCVFQYYTSPEYQSEKYKEIASEIKKYYNGKIGIEGRSLSFLTSIDINYIDFVVVGFNPNGEPETKEIFGNVEENLDSIEQAWSKFFSKEEWRKLKDKETYLLVTLPSYDGALRKGWIEPGRIYTNLHRDFKEQALGYEGMFRVLYKQDVPLTGIISYGYWWNDRLYPETPNLRNDLSHSIRSKDAEHVFYKWSRIFK